MKYLITAKILYGLPFVVEADSADEALSAVSMGKAVPGQPVLLSTLPVAQWTVEPMAIMSTLVEMRTALQDVTSLFREVQGLDYGEPRVAAVFKALALSEETISQVQTILGELNDRESSGTLPAQDG